MTPPVKRTEKTRFSTVAEVSEFLNVSRMTVHRMIDRGELPAFRISNTVRVPDEAVHEYLDKNKIGPNPKRVRAEKDKNNERRRGYRAQARERRLKAV